MRQKIDPLYLVNEYNNVRENNEIDNITKEK